jgi:hypothetical protein
MKQYNLNISIPFTQILSVVKNLSNEEKLTLHNAIWQDDLVIPKEHQRIVKARIVKAKKNKSSLLDWNKVSNKL